MNRTLKVFTMALFFFALLASKDILAADLKQYLIAALDAPDGQSDGELDGSMAEFFKTQTRSSSSVKVTVRTVKKYTEAGCARLEATLMQDGVPIQDGKLIPFAVRYELNLCRDGHPPTEAIDLDAASQALSHNPHNQK
jgi:hypothetical protein